MYAIYKSSTEMNENFLSSSSLL